MKKFFKYFFLTLLVFFLLIQFYPRPDKNVSAVATENDISKRYAVPSDVSAILATACNDCHSNNTVYPWYASVQPVSEWLGNHIKDGKRHLNFSEFLSYRLAKQFHKLEEVEETISEGEMPLSSYTVIHGNAKLDQAQKNILINWSRALRDSMRSAYPADSLIMPKRKK
jgi:hypothetical protein